MAAFLFNKLHYFSLTLFGILINSRPLYVKWKWQTMGPECKKTQCDDKLLVKEIDWTLFLLFDFLCYHRAA